MSSASTTTVTSSCHCGANKFSISLDSSALPAVIDYCHCTACRQSTGVAFNSYLEIPNPLFPSYASPPSTLRTYKTSDHGTRYFCATCGAHMAIEFNEGMTWYVAVGTLDRVEGVYRVGWHQYLKDTGDGGVARIMDDGLDRYGLGKDGEKYVPLAVTGKDGKQGDTDELAARCRCGGVTYMIKRPSAIPDGPGVKKEASADLKRWNANVCFCSDCRLAAGFPVVSWMFVGRDHLTLRDPEHSTLQKYESSPGVQRGFCGRCGATVTYDQPGVLDAVDVAVALLDVDVEKGEGVAAVEAEWLEWEREPMLPADGRDKDLMQVIANGMKTAYQAAHAAV